MDFFFPYIKTEGVLWFIKHPLKFSHHDVFKQCVSWMSGSGIRASTAGVVNVLNAKFLAHLPHQTQKTSNIRCVKFYNFYNMYTVPLQICNGTELKWYNFNNFLFSFLSPLYSVFTLSFSLLSHLYSFSPFPSLLSHPNSLCSLFSL